MPPADGISVTITHAAVGVVGIASCDPDPSVTCGPGHSEGVRRRRKGGFAWCMNIDLGMLSLPVVCALSLSLSLSLSLPPSLSLSLSLSLFPCVDRVSHLSRSRTASDLPWPHPLTSMADRQGRAGGRRRGRERARHRHHRCCHVLVRLFAAHDPGACMQMCMMDEFVLHRSPSSLFRSGRPCARARLHAHHTHTHTHLCCAMGGAGRARGPRRQATSACPTASCGTTGTTWTSRMASRAPRARGTCCPLLRARRKGRTPSHVDIAAGRGKDDDGARSPPEGSGTTHGSNADLIGATQGLRCAEKGIDL